MQHAGGKILIKKLELLFPYFINESIYIYHLISLSGLRTCLVGLSDLRSSSLLFFLCMCCNDTKSVDILFLHGVRIYVNSECIENVQQQA